jgi:putative NADPH-quinone reductase
MRILYLYAHPLPESFHHAISEEIRAGLREAGHEVDFCDLYAEGFDPVLSAAERRGYHTLPDNRAPCEAYIRRVEQAEALVLSFPTWSFGLPAILKGFFDRVFLPGVSFKMVDGKVKPNLHHITKLTAVVTYGGARWRALGVGDPPRKIVKRVLRAQIKPLAPVGYLAHYDMNRSTDATRAAFLRKVAAEMERF